MDQYKAKMILAEMNAAIKEIAGHHGLTVEGGGGVILNNGGIRFKAVELLPADTFGNEWNRCAPLVGLPTDAVGRSFTAADGVRFKITGFRPSAPKRPVMATDDRGRTFVFPAAAVAAALKVSQ